jgi:hypothetical protein
MNRRSYLPILSHYWGTVVWNFMLSEFNFCLLNLVAAKLALQAGVAGIIVSNHGARQLDYVPATISALEEVCFLDCMHCRHCPIHKFSKDRLVWTFSSCIKKSPHDYVWNPSHLVGCASCIWQSPSVPWWRCTSWHWCSKGLGPWGGWHFCKYIPVVSSFHHVTSLFEPP